VNVQTPITPATVLHAVTRPDRIPVKRYQDPAFYALENEKLWPKVWQMACRLEQIPRKGDYAVYENVGQSIIVMRVDETTVKAFMNHCRHRGVQLVTRSGHSSGGFICPFHGWRWNTRGENTFVYTPEAFADDNLCREDVNLVEARCEIWGGCAFVNLDPQALPLRDSLGEFAERMEMWKVDELRVEWWKAARIPCNWKLAMEAFHEGYHVATTHPQLLPPGTTNRPGDARYARVPAEMVTRFLWTTMGKDRPSEVEAKAFAEMNVYFMGVLSEGMAGMTHEREVEIARRLIGTELPSDPIQATATWRSAVNEAVTDFYREQGNDPPDLDALDRKGWAQGVNFAFPHFFLLPTYGSASSYRIRPLGPEETLFELWSLTRYPPGEKRPIPKEPAPLPHDDPSWPPIPAQDYSNLPRQQKGLHSGMEYMRLSQDFEGLISNYQRLIDGYLADLPRELLVKAVREVSGPIDTPIRDLGF